MESDIILQLLLTTTMGIWNAVPNNLENPIQIFTIIPHTNDPGVTYGEGNGTELEITHNGTADGGPIVTLLIPLPQVTSMKYFSHTVRKSEIEWRLGSCKHIFTRKSRS